MGKIALVFEGDDAAIQVGLDALAEKYGWTEQSGITKIEAARKLIGDFVRAAISEVKQRQADIQTQAIVDAALAQKEQILQQTLTQISGAMDSVILKAEVE